MDSNAIQRDTFLSAESAFKKGDNSHYLALKAKLKEYPLLPYLEYMELRQQLKTVSDTQINSYLENNQDLPLNRLLRNAWLDQLAKQGRWESYLKFYLPDSNTRRRCNYLQAQLQTGQANQALPQVEELWLHGNSQPDACDPVFAAWRNAGQLTTELVWQRIELAMQARRVELARHLRSLLPAAQQPWLDRWLQLHRNPEEIELISELNIPSPLEEQILLHGIRQLAREDGVRARLSWQRLAKKHPFSVKQQRMAEFYLVYAMIRDKQPDLLATLDEIKPDNEDTRLAEARIRAALLHRDWERVQRWISALPSELRQTETWQYWDARARYEQGDSATAQAIWKKLAKERSYHGFLAADRLQSAYQFGHVALTADNAKLKWLSELPGIRRARELYLLERIQDARREWTYVVRDLEGEKLKAAAQLAHDWGWHERAIFALAQGKQWQDMEMRFPLEHRPEIETMAQQQQLDTAWVFAVIRQESAFMRDAHSPVGAQGLMQLMPKTARAEAKKLGLRPPRGEAVLQPELNIKLGSAHLRRAMDQLEQNQVLATAAYNAGVHRVNAWMPDETMEAELWVALVPFKETRLYLQRVLAYSIIYQQRLGLEQQRLASRMAPIKPLDTPWPPLLK